MATNFVQNGHRLTFTAAAAADSGDVVKIGDVVGIATNDAAIGEPLTLAIGGVYEVPKTEAQAWTVGAVIYVTSAGLATTASSGNTKIGHAWAPAENPSATGIVRLTPAF